MHKFFLMNRLSPHVGTEHKKEDIARAQYRSQIHVQLISSATSPDPQNLSYPTPGPL